MESQIAYRETLASLFLRFLPFLFEEYCSVYVFLLGYLYFFSLSDLLVVVDFGKCLLNISCIHGDSYFMVFL